MSRVQLIFGFLVAFLAQVAAHGHLSVPSTRDYNLRQDQQNAPVSFPLSSDFVCRNYSATPSSLWTTLVAGSTTPIKWAMEAPHPGDCSAYLTYDGDDVIDTQKKWFKIAEFSQCNLQNLQSLTLNIPSYLPPCEHCILRWEWVALHLQSIDIVEFYSQCADVKIVGNPNGQLPSPQMIIPGHLPMDAKYYRAGYNSDDLHITGPPIASIGGADYTCVSVYGSSCDVPSPTNNPCKISTQRCMSDTTYQACGIGSTTTIWGPEQSCQTGLVCANHSDGQHIMCTYPKVVSSAANACNLQDMRCVGESSYQVCSMSNSGTYWADAQTCQTGQYCNPNGNSVYCALTKPISSSTSTSTSTSSQIPVPVPVTPTVPVPVPVTPTPVPSTPVSVPVPTSPVSSSSSDPTVSSSCSTIGYQRCTSDQSSTYQTCSPRGDGTNYWAAAQSCQTGLSCHPSTTANNIYCY